MGYSAAGKMAPPMIIYAYKQHISHDIAEAVEAVESILIGQLVRRLDDESYLL